MMYIFSILICIFIPLNTCYSFSGVGEFCHKNLDVAWNRAIEEAKLAIVSKHSGQQINSKSLMVNSELIKNIITCVSSAKLTNIKILSKKENSCSISQVGLCCNVAVSGDIEDNPKNSLKISIVMNKNDFRHGESIVISLFTTLPCYPYVFFIDENENVFRLFPNILDQNQLLNSNMNIPTDRMKMAGFDLKAISLDHDTHEEILCICTKKQNQLLESFFPDAFSETLQANTCDNMVTADKISELLIDIGAMNYSLDSVSYNILAH